MKFFLILTFVSLFTSELLSHPSYGMIVTVAGDIIFCDVLHNDGTIWKYSSDGKLSALLNGEHCHFLFEDLHGNIWGTDHDYLPDDQTNLNTLWKLSPSYEKVVVLGPTKDASQFGGVNFAVNGRGEIHFDWQGQIYRYTGSGPPSLAAAHKFGRIMSLQMDQLGDLYIVDNNSDRGSIYKMNNQGEIQQVTRQLLDTEPEDPPFDNPIHNMLFGCFVDESLNVFVANCGSRRVTRITEGVQEHIYHSEAPWFPVAFASRNGRSYVMECGFIEGVGNIGPRILELIEDEWRVLVDVDQYVRER